MVRKRLPTPRGDSVTSRSIATSFSEGVAVGVTMVELAARLTSDAQGLEAAKVETALDETLAGEQRGRSNANIYIFDRGAIDVMRPIHKLCANCTSNYGDESYARPLHDAS